MPHQSAISRFTRVVETAGGLYAPGHLGELTQHIPFELVDDVLERTGRVQQRLRQLPSRIGVYLLLAAALFPSVGYVRVWGKLVAGLGPLGVAHPSEKALRDLRRRLGPAPLKLLFETLAGPVGRPAAPGVRYRRWRTVALDGCSSIKAPDQPRVRGWLGKILRPNGWDGYPMLRLMALCETGTRSLLGAVFGPTGCGETGYARRLLPLLDDSMLLLADRGFDSDDFLAQVADTRAQLLIRLNGRRTPAVLTRLPDGSYLTRINGRTLRIIEARIASTCDNGQQIADSYRLATTLLDHRADPAAALVRLYHERWEVESAFYALRHTLLDGLVLRSRDPFGLEQELWAQLTVYQALRRAMAEATDTDASLDPDRASFTIALETARDQVTTAQGILPTSPGTGGIAQAILSGLLPKRRARLSARKVKSALSRYPGNPADGRPLTSRNITHLAIAIYTPQSGTAGPGTPAPTAFLGGQGNRDRTLQLLRTDADRPWNGREIADSLGIDHYRSFCAQLGHWVKDGLLDRTGRGLYELTAEWRSPATITDLPPRSTA
ncbi:IS4 family transposase [Streptomyces sp. NBC_01236]|uniref:IS4 family transposase n=1 Tax=Streptomyces sp. NBC_01236 TaxID=2903789 RepID=UPI002E12F2F2|nr:IS4 family transposase [Streptomyces sp. NBC_01236]